MGVVEIVIVCVAVGWVAMSCGRGARCLWRVPVKLLAIGAICAGIFVFAHRAKRHHEPTVAVPRNIEAAFDGDRVVVSRPGPDRRHREVYYDLQSYDAEAAAPAAPIVVKPPHINIAPHIKPPHIKPPHIDPVVEPRIDINPDLPFDRDFGLDLDFQKVQTDPPRWMLISLGAVLVIGGWMLLTRDRSRPFALKAVTALGLAATVFVLWSFFYIPAGQTSGHGSRDRVVRVSSDEQEHEIAQSATAPAPAEKSHKAKRPMRRGKPVERNVARHDVDELPPRAGEIPVAAELARQAPAASQPPAETPEAPAESPEAKPAAAAPAAAPSVAEATAPPASEPAAAPTPPAEPVAAVPASAPAPRKRPPRRLPQISLHRPLRRKHPPRASICISRVPIGWKCPVR